MRSTLSSFARHAQAVQLATMLQQRTIRQTGRGSLVGSHKPPLRCRTVGPRPWPRPAHGRRRSGHPLSLARSVDPTAGHRCLRSAGSDSTGPVHSQDGLRSPSVAVRCCSTSASTCLCKSTRCPPASATPMRRSHARRLQARFCATGNTQQLPTAQHAAHNAARKIRPMGRSHARGCLARERRVKGA